MLSTAHRKELTDRALNPDLAIAMGTYTGRRLRDGSVAPDVDGDILCFAYREAGKEINTKHQRIVDGERKFTQLPGRPKTFFNADVLFDEMVLEELEAGNSMLILTEGEFDALAVAECGYEAVMSVPDGAPPARDNNGRLIEVPEDTRDVDFENDIKYAYLGRLWGKLERVKTFVIATDGDEPGGRLAKEIVRRLGAARCHWIDYPKEPVVPDTKSGDFKFRPCKDLNEVKQYIGPDKVVELIENARQWPVKGLYRFSDFPDLGELITYPTGLSPELDELFRPYPGAFIVTTGIPNMGKSVIVKQICVAMALNYGWMTVMFPGEEPVRPMLMNSLSTMFLKKHREEWTDEDRRKSELFLDQHFRIVANDGRNNDDEIDIDYLIERASTSVFRDGAKILVIDPWNELEHRRDRQWSQTEYVGEAIRKLKRFGRTHDCCVWVVAHPKKIDDQPGLYDISDSAHWANKPDLALIVHSDNPYGTARDIIIPKVRFAPEAGRKGTTKMEFDKRLGIYIPVEAAAGAFSS